MTDNAGGGEDTPGETFPCRHSRLTQHFESNTSVPEAAMASPPWQPPWLLWKWRQHCVLRAGTAVLTQLSPGAGQDIHRLNWQSHHLCFKDLGGSQQRTIADSEHRRKLMHWLSDFIFKMISCRHMFCCLSWPTILIKLTSNCFCELSLSLNTTASMTML